MNFSVPSLVLAVVTDHCVYFPQPFRVNLAGYLLKICHVHFHHIFSKSRYCLLSYIINILTLYSQLKSIHSLTPGFSIRCILLLSFKPRLYLLLFLPRSFKICISRPPQMYYMQLFIQYEYSLPISRSGHLQASPFTIIYDIFALFAVIQYRAMCFIRTLLYRLYAHTSY
jgi:hypothetical protein